MTRETDPKSLLDHAHATEVLAQVLATVHAVVRRVLGHDDPEHEDVVQTTLEQLLTFSSQKAARDHDFARQWASVVARNVAVDALRARSRERRVLSRSDDASTTQRPSYLDPERIASARESLARFSERLVRLRETSAQIVYMHDVLGHSLAEISVELEMSVAAAQSRLVRGRRQITNDEAKRKSPVSRRSRRDEEPPAESTSRRVDAARVGSVEPRESSSPDTQGTEADDEGSETSSARRIAQGPAGEEEGRPEGTSSGRRQ